MSKPSQPILSRRTMFAGAGTVGALAAAATLLPAAVPSQPAASAQPSSDDDQDGRYRATAHVMRYYQTAKV